MKYFLLAIYLFSLILNSQCAYKLVWSDEFNGATLNSADWNIEDTNVVYSNELEAYNKANVALSNGNLVLTAKKAAYLGKSYQSGRINTSGKKSFTFGKFEASMKFPVGQGFWPAFWLMAPYNANSYGEIDIMEAVGNLPKTVYGTCWTGGPGSAPYGMSGEYNLATNYDQEYHVYGVEWLPGVLNFYVDGKVYHSCTKAKSKGWEIDNTKFYVIFNLAVGGNWPGSPSSSTVFPSSMYVDWVRVYQDDGSTPTPTPTPTPSGKTSCSSYTSTLFKGGIRYLSSIGKVNVAAISSKTVTTQSACCALCGNTVYCIALQYVAITSGYTCTIYKQA